jgi:hypothetical protein
MENYQLNNQRVMDQIKQVKDRIIRRTQKIERFIANNEEMIYRTTEDGSKEWIDNNNNDLKNK